jgi:hypothetical protein
MLIIIIVLVPLWKRVPPTGRPRCGWCMRQLRFDWQDEEFSNMQSSYYDTVSFTVYLNLRMAADTLSRTRAKLQRLTVTQYLLGMGGMDLNITTQVLGTADLLHSKIDGESVNSRKGRDRSTFEDEK